LMRASKGNSMRVKAAASVTAAVFGIALWIPATAHADDIVWNPFLFIQYCSTCGPQIPLTLEQADVRDILPFGILPGLPPDLGPGPIDDGVVAPFVPPVGVGGGAPNGGGPTPPPPSNGGGLSAGGNSSGGNSSGGNSSGGNSSGGNVGGGGNSNNANGGNGGGPNAGGGNNGGGNSDYSFLDTFPGPNDGTPGNSPTENSAFDGSNLSLTDGSSDPAAPVVPEPTTLVLLGTGISAAVLRRRRGQRTGR
jgi:hypothetical protein